MLLEELNSSLSPVLHADIVLSINTLTIASYLLNIEKSFMSSIRSSILITTAVNVLLNDRLTLYCFISLWSV